jgi:hypothetical protein
MHLRPLLRRAGALGAAWRTGVLALALCLLVCSCASTNATGSSGAAGGSTPSSSAASSQASSGGASSGTTGTYTPAAGTDQNGALLQTYTNHKLRFHMLIPGGWRVSQKHGVVRIAKLGNVIVIVSRTGKFPPKAKGVSTALTKQVKKHTILAVRSKPRSIKLPHAGKVVRVVFTKDRPATDTTPEGTLIVTRYLLFHNNRIIIMSMQTPSDRHNAPIYNLLAKSITWDKG